MMTAENGTSKNKAITALKYRIGSLTLNNPEDITSGNSICKVVCDNHGPCWEFKNPFIPRYSAYLKKSGCPKCSGKYRPTDDEYKAEVLTSIHPTLNYVSRFSFNGLKTKAYVKCKIHGNCWEFGNPWVPTYKILKLGNPCIKCQGKYNRTEEEAVDEIERTLYIRSPSLSLSGIEEYKNQNSRCLVTCKKHGALWLWEVVTKPTVQQLLKDPKCLKCNGTYVGIKDEKLREINVLLSKCVPPHLTVIDILGNLGDTDLCIVECPIHGRLDEWQSATFPTVGNMKRTHLRDNSNGCPKCGGNYRYSEAEYEEQVRKHLAEVNPKLTLIAIERFKNNQSRCFLRCKEHGLLSEFNKKCKPQINKVLSYKKGDGCPKCSEKYRETVDEVMLRWGYESGRDVYIRAFDSLTGYIGLNSQCLVTCSQHGNGETFGTPYIPRLENFKKSPFCPKCNGSYKRTKEETIEELNDMYRNHIIVHDIPHFQNSETRVMVECIYHGPGWLFDKPWEPTSGHLRRGRGCPKCFHEGSNLIKLMNNPHQNNKERILYFAKVTVQKTGEIFYKIGLRTNRIRTRYPKSNLTKDGIVLEELSSYTADNLSVSLAEYLSFLRFAEYRINREEVLVHCSGGTECFRKNLLELITLEQLVINARNDQNQLLENFKIFNRYEKD